MRRRFYKIFSSRLPALVWTIVIFVLLSLPGKMLPDESNLGIPQLDKYVHIFLFGSFVFLWSFYYAFKMEKRISNNSISIRALIIACLYGITMEFVQKYFIPNRDFDLYDILADIIGALGGFFIFRASVYTFIDH
jgi:VanZ family protein